MVLLLLSSGLLLGWSLGANDAANVFGTAVATRMLRFRTAVTYCSIFVILGAVISGAGATDTLGQLGAVNALGGSFMVALAAALSVVWMTKAGLPVSTSQAIVGAIVGWNLFTGSQTDAKALIEIVSSWVASPILAGAFAALFYAIARRVIERQPIHLLKLDAATRVSLIVAGAFGAYSLGANNIANVMGAFVPAFPVRSFHIAGVFSLSMRQLLFMIGGFAIAVGAFTYSRRVMMTVGKGLFRLTPVTALVVVLSEAIVLFLFASQSLESWLLSHGLPAIPLVPVSSSQAVIGAIIGIAIVKGGKGVRYTILGRIAAGWATTPAIAAVIAFVGLFFLQNVFGLTVAKPEPYAVTQSVLHKLEQKGVPGRQLDALTRLRFGNARSFERALDSDTELTPEARALVLEYAKSDSFYISPRLIGSLDHSILNEAQISAIAELADSSFSHEWQFREALARISPAWRPPAMESPGEAGTRPFEIRHVLDTFRVPLRRPSG
jgi:inorganic phosphate transporter, PiT family